MGVSPLAADTILATAQLLAKTRISNLRVAGGGRDFRKIRGNAVNRGHAAAVDHADSLCLLALALRLELRADASADATQMRFVADGATHTH